MKKTNLLLLLSNIMLQLASAQNIGIGTTTPNASSKLEINSTTSGLLIPRMTAAQRTGISSPATGLLVYDTDSSSFAYYAGSSWTFLRGTDNIANNWNTSGNSNTTSNNFIGTRDSNPVRVRVNNRPAGIIDAINKSVAWGDSALYSNTSYSNIAIGAGALRKNIDRSNTVAIGDSALYNVTTGSFFDGLYNTAIGSKALFANTTGYDNTGVGFQALMSNTTGSHNMGCGSYVLLSNTTGNYNTAGGSYTLQANTTGTENTAFGATSLYHNTSGSSNSAVGRAALITNTTGSRNSAVGVASLLSNSIGTDNSAIGYNALYSNTTGGANTAIGSTALFTNSTGVYNSALGYQALYSNSTGDLNTAMGYASLYANTSGTANTGIGNGALYSNTVGNFNAAVGSAALTLNNGGNYNCAMGSAALLSNTTGAGNSAMGFNSLYSNSLGSANSAMGYEALKLNSVGTQNTAIGVEALYSNTFAGNNTAGGAYALYFNTGGTNTAIGSYALYSNTTGAQNTSLGSNSLYNNQTGSFNTAVGFQSGTSGSFDNTVSIGNNGWLNGASNQAFIGNGSTSWIGGWVGWSIYSDARMKTKVTEDVKGLDFINRLRPVTYYRSIGLANQLSGNKGTDEYPEKYEVEKIQYSGFLAQEVEQAANEAGYNFSGITKPKTKNDLYSLSYESFVVPLVKAVQEQQQQIELLKKQNELLLNRLDALENKKK